jgi:hypothetical protein
MSPAPRVTIGMTTYNNRSGEVSHSDRTATLGSFIVVWAISRVRIRLGAWRRQIGARCVGSTRTAVG